MADPQKSEVHDTTADPSSSPTAEGDSSTTRQAGTAARMPGGNAVEPDIHLSEVEVVSDDSDDGGPIVIKSDDPELQHLDLPADPFPTDRTPEIDPPIKK